MAKIEELYDFIDSLTFGNMYDKRANADRNNRYLSYWGNPEFPSDETIHVTIYDTHMFIEKRVFLRPQSITETVNRNTPEGEATVQRFITAMTKKCDKTAKEYGHQCPGELRPGITIIKNFNDVYKLITSKDFQLTKHKDPAHPDEYVFYDLYNFYTHEKIIIDIYKDRMELSKLTLNVPEYQYRETIQRKEQLGANLVDNFIEALSRRRGRIVYDGVIEQKGKTK